MAGIAQRVKKFFLVLYLVIVHLALVYFAGDWVATRYLHFRPLSPDLAADPTASTPVPTPIPVPSVLYDPAANANNSALAGQPDAFSNRGLLIPVLGVTREQLLDAFSDARSGGRIHDAIDIAAPGGTPVVAAAEGEIVKFHDSEAGGITIYQLSGDKRYVFYYAHLQRRADNLREGDRVTAGTVIGYVGDTGNAGAGNFHLHFSIAAISDPKHFFTGTYINPYPLLVSGAPLP